MYKRFYFGYNFAFSLNTTHNLEHSAFNIGLLNIQLHHLIVVSLSHPIGAVCLYKSTLTPQSYQKLIEHRIRAEKQQQRSTTKKPEWDRSRDQLPFIFGKNVSFIDRRWQSNVVVDSHVDVDDVWQPNKATLRHIRHRRSGGSCAMELPLSKNCFFLRPCDQKGGNLIICADFCFCVATWIIF